MTDARARLAEVLAKVRVLNDDEDPASWVSASFSAHAAVEVHGHVPFWRSLDWRLASLHWGSVGVEPFVRNEVPYAINNSGRLSTRVAEMLFASCVARPASSQPIVAIELGAGSGLFARYLLDAFEALCAAGGRDFYDRLVLVVTDRSRRSVERWKDDGMFDVHRDHVALGTCDAALPESFQPSGPGPRVDLDALHAVLFNYVLDSLPATIVRRRGTEIDEIWMRSILTDPETVGRRTGLTPEDVRALAASPRDEDVARLTSLLGSLQTEASFAPAEAAVRSAAEQAFAVLPTAERLVLNFGALAALRKWTSRLSDDGFALINDFAARNGPDGLPKTTWRYGRTLAVGLGFGWIDRVLEADGLHVCVPEGDADRRIQTRLLTRNLTSDVSSSFHALFDLSADRHLDAPIEEAREHAAAGRKNEALDAFRVALSRNPRDWVLIAQIAEFVAIVLHDYDAAIELARGALAINPWLSPSLWNLIGECQFAAKRIDEAHASYLAAQRLDAHEPRTHLNLACTFLEREQFSEALGAIARGLAIDGALRGRLLEKQEQVLSAISSHVIRERARERRIERIGRLE